jgi:hypothetical protein
MTDRIEQLARYQRLRKVGMEVNSTITSSMRKSALEVAAKKLGVLKGKTLVLSSEHEMAVLNDFCLHDTRHNGRTPIEEFAQTASYPPGSLENTFLSCLLQARFTIFLVEVIEPGFGVHARDLLWGGTKFIVDVSLSQTAEPGLLLVSRILPFEDDLFMTSGAALPFGMGPPDAANDWGSQSILRKFDALGFDRLAPELRSELTAALIRECLNMGASEHIEYQEPGAGSGLPPRPVRSAQPQRIGRNDPCPCGSGKKFKKCCGARQ